MAFPRDRVGITREDLAQQCLRELWLWPGCEAVERLAVLMSDDGEFTVHVDEYGSAAKKSADRALRYIQREKSRRFRLKID
jgi:hypothetical protein